MPRAAKLIALVALIAIVIIAVRALPVAREVARFQEWVRAAGPVGYVAYAAVYAVGVAFLVPGTLLTIGAGVVFGVVGGSIVVVAGATAGATLAYFLARSLLRKRVTEWAARDKRFEAIDRAVTREGAKIVLLVRLSVVFPFTWVNYIFGLTGVAPVPYVIATAAGIVPATIAFVYIGAAAGEALTTAGQLRTAVYLLGAASALAVSIYVGRIAAREIRRSAL